MNGNECWYRYSNTLLFSLNNRISIRELSRRSEAVLPSRTRPNSTAKDGQGVVLLERARPPYAFKERKQSEETVEDDGQEVGISKCCSAPFPAFFQHLDLIDRYRMIWTFNGRTPWTTNTTTGSIIYFCTVTCESCLRHGRFSKIGLRVLYRMETHFLFILCIIRSGRKFFELSLNTNTNYLGAHSRFAV